MAQAEGQGACRQTGRLEKLASPDWAGAETRLPGAGRRGRI